MPVEDDIDLRRGCCPRWRLTDRADGDESLVWQNVVRPRAANTFGPSPLQRLGIPNCEARLRGDGDDGELAAEIGSKEKLLPIGRPDRSATAVLRDLILRACARNGCT